MNLNINITQLQEKLEDAQEGERLALEKVPKPLE